MGDANAATPAVCCAFDGSVNAHWVARYAIRLAAAVPVRTLRILHVDDGAAVPVRFAERLLHLEAECRRAGVRPVVRELPAARDIARALLESLPPGAGTVLVCGTRAGARAHRLITGTVSERLLRAGRCHVLAVRVLAPGLLGAARRLLLPVAGHPGEARAAAPLLRLLLPGADELHLLRVMPADRRTVDHASSEAMQGLRAHGMAAVTHYEAELRAVLPLTGLHVDTHVRVAEDWTRAAVVVAGIYHTELVLAGGSDRELGGGWLSPSPLERLLARAPCDIGIYRAAAQPAAGAQDMP